MPIHPETPLVGRRLLDGATTQLEAVLITVQQLIEELAKELLQKEIGVRSLSLEFLRMDAPPVTRDLMLGIASRDAGHLWNLFRPKVEGVHLGYGVEGIVLTARWTESIAHKQLGAWQTGEMESHDAEYAALLDTLVNRWGSERVLAAQAVASHTPEVARQFRPALEKQASGKSEKGEMVLLDRPSMLFEQPEPAEAIALQPDRPPSYLHWRGEGRELKAGYGPERTVTAWWNDREMSARDYFKVQLQDGTWLWVFRVLESGRWFVHGLWA